MISMLRGAIWAVEPGCVVLNVNGVGYTVQCVQPLLNELREQPGQEIELYIETAIREDAITLYGFELPDERTWFRVLTGVQGVGGKTAMLILGMVGIEGLLSAIASQDPAPLKQVKGIGERIAMRIITELKDKVTEADRKAMEGLAVDADMVATAKAALMKLGFKANESGAAAKKAAMSASSNSGVSEIVRGALLELNSS